MKTSFPLLSLLLAVMATTSLVSCIQPPPPRVYNPQSARRLWHVAHDVPVTPMPAERGIWWGWGYPYYCY